MTDAIMKPHKPIRPGAALKALRIARGWSLAEVGERTGLPVSSLSKFENDKMEMTLDRLVRISVALDTDIAALFTPPSSQHSQTEASGRRSITRAGEGNVISSGIGRYEYLAFDMLNKNSIPMIIDVTCRSMDEFGEWNRHPGEELLYIVEGTLDLYTSMYLPVRLAKGDSMYFDANMGHAYIAIGDEPCRVLSVCVAPESELIEMIERKRARSDGLVADDASAGKSVER